MTRWLASTLNSSPTHKVVHEHDRERVPPRKMFCALRYEPFPIERWLQSVVPYGEVHQHLIRSLIGPPGDERLIPRRAILLRNTHDTVRSWLAKQHGYQDAPVAAVTYMVIRRQQALKDYAASDRDCRVLRAEDLVSNMESLQDLSDWLGMSVQYSTTDMRPLNVTPKSRKFSWTPTAEKEYRATCERFGEPITRCLGASGATDRRKTADHQSPCN